MPRSAMRWREDHRKKWGAVRWCFPDRDEPVAGRENVDLLRHDATILGHEDLGYEHIEHMIAVGTVALGANVHHLDHAGVTRRRVVREMTDESVALAAARYEQGASLAVVGKEFGVHQRTLARELPRAGTGIRQRSRWRR